jgi:hypothetical protein
MQHINTVMKPVTKIQEFMFFIICALVLILSIALLNCETFWCTNIIVIKILLHVCNVQIIKIRNLRSRLNLGMLATISYESYAILSPT